MKSSILTLFIIFNLLAINLVSASNMFEEEVSESHLVQQQSGFSLDEAALTDCINEFSCDHFCHVTSHMLGMISQFPAVTTTGTSVAPIITQDILNSLTLDTPSEPPRTLI